MKSRHRAIVSAIGLFASLSGAVAFGAQDPAAVFVKKCSGCHTFGRGIRVGPDLKGATDGRTRPWLRSWIRSSQRLIEARDPTATALYDTFKRERMPDQALSDGEIDALLDFLASGGPLAAAGGRPRHAGTATADEISVGRDL